MSDAAAAAPKNPPPSDGARRILIVGGVAGGASCAARLRRLDESVEIVVFDRGPYVAFANCGLPYFVGDVIADERALLVSSPERFQERFNVAVRINTDVVSVDPAARTIRVHDLHTGSSRTERYDVLVLSRARRRSGRRCRVSTCPASSRCATFRILVGFGPGLPIAAPAPQSSSVGDSSDWRWSRT
jgi:hypothetical protein